jgi:hypothetical protein
MIEPFIATLAEFGSADLCATAGFGEQLTEFG